MHNSMQWEHWSGIDVLNYTQNDHLNILKKVGFRDFYKRYYTQFLSLSALSLFICLLSFYLINVFNLYPEHHLKGGLFIWALCITESFFFFYLYHSRFNNVFHPMSFRQNLKRLTIKDKKYLSKSTHLAYSHHINNYNKEVYNILFPNKNALLKFTKKAQYTLIASSTIKSINIPQKDKLELIIKAINNDQIFLINNISDIIFFIHQINDIQAKLHSLSKK